MVQPLRLNLSGNIVDLTKGMESELEKDWPQDEKVVLQSARAMLGAGGTEFYRLSVCASRAGGFKTALEDIHIHLTTEPTPPVG